MPLFKNFCLNRKHGGREGGWQESWQACESVAQAHSISLQAWPRACLFVSYSAYNFNTSASPDRTGWESYHRTPSLSLPAPVSELCLFYQAILCSPNLRRKSELISMQIKCHSPVWTRKSVWGRASILRAVHKNCYRVEVNGSFCYQWLAFSQSGKTLFSIQNHSQTWKAYEVLSPPEAYVASALPLPLLSNRVLQDPELGSTTALNGGEANIWWASFIRVFIFISHCSKATASFFTTFFEKAEF